MAEGFVYILTNEFMPGIVKIGYTNRSPEQRAWELYEKRTGVPGKFQVAFRFKCRDAKGLERKVHKQLAAQRVNAYREYFKVDLSHAVGVIHELSEPHQLVISKPTVVKETSADRSYQSTDTADNSNIKLESLSQEPVPLHRIRSDFEKACDEADYASRFTAFITSFCIIAFLAIVLEQEISSYEFAKSPFTMLPLTVVAIFLYSALRRFFGRRQRAKIEEEYRRKVER